MKNILVDFDDTLDRKDVQGFMKFLTNSPTIKREVGEIKIWIISQREPNVDAWNTDLFEIARELDIPDERIHIIGGEPKWEYVKRVLSNIDFKIILEDDEEEIKLFMENTTILPINVKHAYNKIILMFL